ncbi:MAG TPA: galactokinase [Pyrinomonadaceae bacterium]|jgi:galactokinase
MLSLDELKNKFEEIYSCEPRTFRAPGRVNLIGEHTDYNDGFVLPFAINREVLAAGAGRADTKINVHALDVDDFFSFDLRDAAVKRRGNWIDYVEGAARCVEKRFALTRGADLIFSSTVPIGAGLSSSAALEVSIGFALLALNEIEINRKELAFAAQEAEHEFVGIRSGIMDQFASVLCEENHALLLDCRSLETRQIPLEMTDAVIAVCDTRVKHELASSAYNARRRECETGVEILREKLPEIESLRDVGEEDFLKFQNLLPENVRKRCRHVISENARTLAAAENLEKSDLETVGRLMRLSHESLRDDYEVSSVELDALVDIALATKDVFGARMTGGGFGGCTVNLLKSEAFAEFQNRITQKYTEKFGFEPEIYLFRASNGASEIK